MQCNLLYLETQHFYIVVYPGPFQNGVGTKTFRMRYRTSYLYKLLKTNPYKSEYWGFSWSCFRRKQFSLIRSGQSTGVAVGLGILSNAVRSLYNMHGWSAHRALIKSTVFTGSASAQIIRLNLADTTFRAFY